MNDFDVYSVFGVYDVNGYDRMRFGRTADGGYIIPEQIVGGLKHCVTYGVCDDISFEQDLASYNPEIRFSMYDYTVDFPPQNTIRHVDFFKKRISMDKTSLDISPAETLDGLTDILLKCDIEGGEYGCIETIPDNIVKHVKCFILELHLLERNFDAVRRIIEYVDRNFILFHAHGNTNAKLASLNGKIIPDVLELTYVNRNLAETVEKYHGPLPIPDIDYSCSIRPDYDLSYLA